MLKRSDIRVRDPYILYDGGVYYMYTTSTTKELSCYKSTDLENWEDGGVIFEITDDSWAYKDLWAPEVHRYNGRFYLFISILGKNGLRGTQIAVSDSPSGIFLPLVNRPVTPTEQSCIDGTLFVQDGVPYIFYSHDWPDCYSAEKDAYVGEICAAELTHDLTEIVGEPWVVFTSDESPISRATPHRMEYEGKQIKRHGSDAPFVQKLSDGRLLLTWSPYLDGNYVVLKVYSESGSVRGPWTHAEKPLFDGNGGHAMFFRDADERLVMCIHAPERNMLERAHVFEVGEQNGDFVIFGEL